VKGGGVNRSDAATLLGDVENQKAAGGNFDHAGKTKQQMRSEGRRCRALTHPNCGTIKIIRASKS